MSSLKALLNSKSFDSVTTSNLEMTNINSRKRGAALEEWLLRKFPELYRKSHDLESTTVAVNDVENQPLTLRTNSYNRISMQHPDSKQDIISSEYYLLPKGDLFALKKEHLSNRVDNGYHKELKSCMDGDLEVEIDKPINLSLS
ncbi:unnamed protein product, partial [Onchocerca flexuosa]|uniref:SHSP domain-containing protein n=1 Tax=Onchocerca flexuosa TaxID=387005 RepID=A0A183I402_9BILA